MVMLIPRLLEKIISGKILGNKIDVMNLRKGIYIVKIKTNEKMFDSKFIKK